MTICQKMFQIMDEKGKKAVDLCKFLNIQTSVTTSWKKRNTDPPAKYLARICEFLEITIEELLDIDIKQLTESEQEMLLNFRKLPEREQIKWIGRLEDAAFKYDVETDAELHQEKQA